jgi:hypothetical protein
VDSVTVPGPKEALVSSRIDTPEVIVDEPSVEWVADRPAVEASTVSIGPLQLTRRSALAVGLVGLGVVLLLVGYVGISGETTVYRQLPYFLSGGIGALFCLGLGGFLLYTSDVERLRSEVRALQEHLDGIESGLVKEFDRLHDAMTDR